MPVQMSPIDTRTQRPQFRPLSNMPSLGSVAAIGREYIV